MLVLSRKKNESIVINENIIITVVEVRGDKVRLGIQAPRDVAIHRSEIYDQLKKLSTEGTAPAPEPAPTDTGVPTSP